MNEIERIKRMAKYKWIKYIRCKKCFLEFDVPIATEPCIKCGGFEFEQFDLVLYHMKKVKKHE